jgi:hypothetical protein
MKCYVHQNTEAVGVCSTCGRGVCNACLVRVGGKFYCKQDAEKAFMNRLTTKLDPEQERAPAVMAGSIVAYLLGAVAIVLSFFVLFAGIMAGDFAGGFFSNLFDPDFNWLGPILTYPQGTIIFIGIGVMVFGSIGIAAGFYLWKRAMGGALIAIVFGILGLIVGFGLESISVSSLIVDVWFVANIVAIALGLIGLREIMLHPPTSE